MDKFALTKNYQSDKLRDVMIYKSIRDYLNHAGKTEKQFAEELGISIPYMNLLKHGKRRPSPELAIKIEKITRIPLRKLLLSEQNFAA